MKKLSSEIEYKKKEKKLKKLVSEIKKVTN